MCIFSYVCMYVCMHVCMYLCMYVSTVQLHVLIVVLSPVCMIIFSYVCMYVYVCTYMYACMYVYVYMCACMYEYERLSIYYNKIGRARHAANGSREVGPIVIANIYIPYTYIHTCRDCLTIQFEWEEDCRVLNEEIVKWKRAYEVRVLIHTYIHTYIHICIHT